MEDKEKTAREACDILNEACEKLDEKFSEGGENDDGMIDLAEAISESSSLKALLEEAQGQDMAVPTEILLLLANIIEEKVCYFSKKYALKVPESNMFMLENFGDFVRMKEGIDRNPEN